MCAIRGLPWRFLFAASLAAAVLSPRTAATAVWTPTNLQTGQVRCIATDGQASPTLYVILTLWKAVQYNGSGRSSPTLKTVHRLGTMQRFAGRRCNEGIIPI
jgi:hypothetical protein